MKFLVTDERGNIDTEFSGSVEEVALNIAAIMTQHEVIRDAIIESVNFYVKHKKDLEKELESNYKAKVIIDKEIK